MGRDMFEWKKLEMLKIPHTQLIPTSALLSRIFQGLLSGCTHQPERTGMALLRQDGVVLVAVRKDMMRVIGDKLLSFLY